MTEINKLNIYYIKPLKSINDIFKDDIKQYKSIVFPQGTLYYNPKNIHTPDWVSGFFKKDLVIQYKRPDGTIEDVSIFNSVSSQAVFITEIDCAKENHIFAIPFGTGIHLLKSDAYVPNFGLKCVLNLVSSDDGLRKISKYDISSSPKQTSQQLSKKGSQIDFNLDYQTDILTGITGSFDDKSKRDKVFIKLVGKTITGGNSFSISARADIKNIDKVLKLAIVAYASKKYQTKGFGWIDNVSYVKNDTLLKEKLNNELNVQLENLTGENDKIWFAVPEIVKWEDIEGFYFGQDKKNLVDDLDLIEYKQYIKSKGKKFNIETLKQQHIFAKDASSSTAAYSWTALQCLNAEIDLNISGKNKTYMLIDRNWYEINHDFKQETNQKFDDYFRKSSGLNFIDCSYKDEDTYNQKLAEENNMICLDKKTISYGGGKSKIEVCDILDDSSKKLIHIKKYSGSSVLSHLFSQGLVAMQLLVKDKKFLRDVERKVSVVKGAPFSFNGNPREYDLVYGIITKSGRTQLNIPFFSKVNLNSVCDRLCQEMNVSVCFDVIKNLYVSKKRK